MNATIRASSLQVVVASGCACLVATAALSPGTALACALGIATVAAVCIRGQLFWWDLILVVLAGSLVLGYGFANIGLASAIPVPLADLLLVVLLLHALATPWLRSAASRVPLVLAASFMSLAAFRLALDFSQWGREAVRDSTLALELGFAFIGYWALRTYGIERWIRSLRWIFLVALGYFALYPLRDELATLGPLVGLQRPVPLLGSYSAASTAAAAGLFFFSIVRPFGRWSYALAAAHVPLFALFQARGLYVAVPTAALVTWVLVQSGSERIRSALARTAFVGSVALALVFVIAPSGRVGQASPGFVVAQLRTLAGSPGPGSGSIEQRVTWFHDVRKEVSSKPFGWLVGLGLGPDLTGGFRATGGNEVRKPHNDYLEVFARLGVVGLALFSAFLAISLCQIVRTARRRPSSSESKYLWWLFATTVVYLLVAATQPLLAFPYGTVPLFLALGGGLALASGHGQSSA